MYQILHKETLSAAVKLVIVEAPLVAARAKAGQFVIVRTDEFGERIPLTIADCDPAHGTITMIFQEVGKSTMQMGQLETGDGFANVVGPLGRPTEVKNYGKVVIVAGGVGVAPLYPVARVLKEAGNQVLTILGARTRDLLFWESRLGAVSDQLIVCTDDGSTGRKALVTEPLKELLETGKDIARVWAIGPAVMMKYASETTRPFQVPTVVSLNTIMIDGTGMCGGCRVMLDDGAKFVCVDGPDFDGHRVDWANLLERQAFYRDQEKLAVEHWKAHTCRLDPAVKAALE